MKEISKREGGSVDTSRDHEYNDWSGVERFAGTILADMSAGPSLAFSSHVGRPGGQDGSRTPTG